MQSTVTRIIIHPCIRENPRLSEEGRGFLSLRSTPGDFIPDAISRRENPQVPVRGPFAEVLCSSDCSAKAVFAHKTKPRRRTCGALSMKEGYPEGCPKSILALVCVGRGRSVWRRKVSPRQNHGVIRIEFPPRPTGYRHLGIFAPLVNDGGANRHEKAPLAVLRCGNSFGVGVPNCVCHLSLVGRGCCSERSSSRRIVCA